jgi:hypothetical protein
VVPIPNGGAGKRSYPPEVWEAVRADFRAGLSYSQLSQTYGIPINSILTRRKREGWRRDLREDVRVETFARLAAADEPGVSQGDDEALVNVAATRAATVVARQRRATGLAVEVCERGLSHAKAELEAAIARNGSAKELAAITSRVLYFSNSLARVVPLERRAYGIDDGSEEKPYEERLAEMAAARAAERAARRAKRHGSPQVSGR